MGEYHDAKAVLQTAAEFSQSHNWTTIEDVRRALVTLERLYATVEEKSFNCQQLEEDVGQTPLACPHIAPDIRLVAHVPQ